MDCTVRDGGYVLGWHKSFDYVSSLCHALQDAQVNWVEVGFVNKHRPGDGPWASLTAELLDRLADTGRRAAAEPLFVAGMLDVGKATPADLRWIRGSRLDMVRIAARPADWPAAFALVPALKDMGVKVSINAMAASHLDALWHTRTLADLAAVSGATPDVIYFADSFGACRPYQISGLVYNLSLALSQNRVEVDIGFHAHDNLRLAFANALAAVDAGATWVDGSVFGVGRGGGNLTTELMVSEWRGLQYVPPLKAWYAAHLNPTDDPCPWGYSWGNLATGAANAHPNYNDSLEPLCQSYAAFINHLQRLIPADKIKHNDHLEQSHEVNSVHPNQGT